MVAVRYAWHVEQRQTKYYALQNVGKGGGEKKAATILVLVLLAVPLMFVMGCGSGTIERKWEVVEKVENP